MTRDSLKLQNIVASAKKNKEEMAVKIKAEMHAESGIIISQINNLGLSISGEFYDEIATDVKNVRSKLNDLLADIDSAKCKEIDAKVKEWSVMKQIPEDHPLLEHIISYVRSIVSENIAYAIFAYQEPESVEN